MLTKKTGPSSELLLFATPCVLTDDPVGNVEKICQLFDANLLDLQAAKFFTKALIYCTKQQTDDPGVNTDPDPFIRDLIEHCAVNDPDDHLLRDVVTWYMNAKSSLKGQKYKLSSRLTGLRNVNDTAVRSLLVALGALWEATKAVERAGDLFATKLAEKLDMSGAVAADPVAESVTVFREMLPVIQGTAIVDALEWCQTEPGDPVTNMAAAGALLGALYGKDVMHTNLQLAECISAALPGCTGKQPNENVFSGYFSQFRCPEQYTSSGLYGYFLGSFRNGKDYQTRFPHLNPRLPAKAWCLRQKLKCEDESEFVQFIAVDDASSKAFTPTNAKNESICINRINEGVNCVLAKCAATVVQKTAGGVRE